MLYHHHQLKKQKQQQSKQKQQQQQQQQQDYIRDAYCTVILHKHKENIDVQLAHWKHNVTTSAGIDQVSINGYTSNSRSGRGFNGIAVTEDTTQTINAAQTALTGEVTTNGFARIEATVRSHSNGSNTSTIGITYTATGAMTNIVRSALFDAVTAPVSGNMGHIAAFASGSGTMAINDTLQVTWTITVS